MMLLTKTLGNAFAILTNGGIIYIVNYSVWPVSLFMTSSSEIRNHVTVPQVFWNVGIFYMKMEKSEKFLTSIKSASSHNFMIYQKRTRRVGNRRTVQLVDKAAGGNWKHNNHRSFWISVILLTRAGKCIGNRDYIVFEKLRFQIFFRLH